MAIFTRNTKFKRKPHAKSMGEAIVTRKPTNRERRELEYQLNFHKNRRMSL